MSTTITPVILCGGAGTRLWPLSRKSLPKQFVPLIGGKSLLQLTLDRVRPLGPGLMVVTAEAHRFMVADALQKSPGAAQVILEPVARNTAAAMALATLQALRDGDDSGLLLFCPADHHIPDAVAFADTVQQGVAAAQASAIVTFGVMPSFPSTAYGYIAQGDARTDGSRRVARFIEKPAAEAAQALLLQGNVLWNAGIFLASAATLKAALQRHANDIWTACEQAMAAPKEEAVGRCRFVRPAAEPFLACRSQSIDYAVMERADNVTLVPARFGWSDVGSWKALWELASRDSDDNFVQGDVVLEDSKGLYVDARRSLVATVGVQDLVIVETADALLVANKGRSQDVSKVVAKLRSVNRKEQESHPRSTKPWGYAETLSIGPGFRIDFLHLDAGAQLSRPGHRDQSMSWTVVRGTAMAILDGAERMLNEAESLQIPAAIPHGLENRKNASLEIIETRIGPGADGDGVAS